MKDDRAEHVQHGESGLTTAESCHKDGPEDLGALMDTSGV
jgi:hypothetical protein